MKEEGRISEPFHTSSFILLPSSYSAGAARFTDQPLWAVYARYRTLSLLVVAGLVMLLSFLWYLPGAYHASSMEEYHTYAHREYRFNNVIQMYVNHNLHEASRPGFILGGTGVEYPALLSTLIRATAQLGVAQEVPFEAYRSGTPPPQAGPQETRNAVAYTALNYAVIFFFGLLAVWLMAHWPGVRPWLFVASPLLFLFAGYNWDLIPIALSMAGLLFLKRSAERPDAGRGYSFWQEAAGFGLLTLGVWFKLFPIVFLAAALIERMRRGMWQATGLGVGLFAAISLLVNLPLALGNYDGWRFFTWIHQNRASELSIWYLLLGGMDPGLMVRPDVTTAVNILSLLIVATGGLVIAALAWRSQRHSVALPLGCMLLLWWLSFNKIYDPNFDIWLLFVLVILGAPLWLYVAVTLMSLNWFLVSFVGHYISTLPGTGEIQAWLLTHTLFGALVIRLAVLAAMLIWNGRVLLTNYNEARP